MRSVGLAIFCMFVPTVFTRTTTVTQKPANLFVEPGPDCDLFTCGDMCNGLKISNTKFTPKCSKIEGCICENGWVSIHMDKEPTIEPAFIEEFGFPIVPDEEIEDLDFNFDPPYMEQLIDKLRKVKPGDIKQDDVETGYVEPDELKAGDVNQGEFKPSEIKPDDIKTGAIEPGNVELGYVKPDDVKSGEFKPSGIEPDDIKTGVIEPGNIEPGDVKPENVEPGDVKPGTVEPGDVKPGNIEPGDVKPGTVEPGDVKPSAVPDEIELGHVEPFYYDLDDFDDFDDLD
uniref:Uncharacterized protein n=1 Tax=Homalodisca liturata TaxID=320908 RepID=A0A1B6IIM3_9HEMI